MNLAKSSTIGVFLSTIFVSCLFSIAGNAAEPFTVPEDAPPQRFNIKAPTLGGLQTWTDELVFRDWRIQRNVFSGLYRLLDGDNQRHAWGTFAMQCKAQLEKTKRQLQLRPVSGPVVLVMHGIIRSRHSMDEVCEYLKEKTDWTIINVSYASTRDTMDSHAFALAKIVANLDPEVTEINFVAHSLGNLVIRRFLHEYYRELQRTGAKDRIRRIVMLTPPNNGAKLTNTFRNTGIMEWVWGKSAVQLADGWNDLENRLATPQCDFGIIAGGQGDSEGISFLLGGDDDFVVGVEETKLPGARDFLVLPVYHSRIMSNETAQECTLRFLQHGHFVSEDQRRPLALDERATP